jgi:hypothetical protein
LSIIKNSKKIKMKKVLSFAIVVLLSISSWGQAQKEELVQRIKEGYSYSWMQGAAFDNMATVNLSETMWTALLDDNKIPQGMKQFAALGTALIQCHDYLYDTKMMGKCDGYSRPSEGVKSDCEKEIIADKNKIHVTINGSSIKFTPSSYRLLMGYTTSVDNFISAGTSSWGFNRNWRPKTKELHIIIELSDKAKDIAVKWSTDGKTATVTGPAYNEVEQWDSKIGKGLERGGAKID